MARKSRAMVLESFNAPLVEREYDLPKLEEGQVLVRALAAGVCGSDVHMWEGRDPRTPRPLILGHEGVGQVVETGSVVLDIFGAELKPGDPVMWDRGLTCGRCYYCTVRKEPYLCPRRRTYGINIGASEYPHLNGGYAEYMVLRAGTNIFKIDPGLPPDELVAAACAGATAAHAVELHTIRPGESVVVIGPGPVGLFVLAFARFLGAGPAVVIGTAQDRDRLTIAKEFGADEVMVVDETSLEERLERVRALTDGRGADHVIDASGSPRAIPDGLMLLGRGGTYSIPGIAVPVGDVPVAVYEQIALKNARFQGVWVSDTSHALAAYRLVRSGRFPFDRLVTHRYALEQANEALKAMKSKGALKAVLLPAG